MVFRPLVRLRAYREREQGLSSCCCLGHAFHSPTGLRMSPSARGHVQRLAGSIRAPAAAPVGFSEKLYETYVFDLTTSVSSVSLFQISTNPWPATSFWHGGDGFGRSARQRASLAPRLRCKPQHSGVYRLCELTAIDECAVVEATRAAPTRRCSSEHRVGVVGEVTNLPVGEFPRI